MRSKSRFVSFVLFVASLPCSADDTNAVSQILKIYGGFEQEKLDGWQPTDPRAPVTIVTTEPREGKQAAEIFLPVAEKPHYYSPGVEIPLRWRWDCARPATLKFSINPRQKLIGFNLFATLQGQSDKGEPFALRYFVWQAGDHWTFCKDGKSVWNPAPEFGKDIAGLEGIVKEKPQSYCAWLPGIAGGEWYAKHGQWFDFEVPLQKAFEQTGAPQRPASITFDTVKIGGYIANQVGYWIDAISLEQK